MILGFFFYKNHFEFENQNWVQRNIKITRVNNNLHEYMYTCGYFEKTVI